MWFQIIFLRKWFGAESEPNSELNCSLAIPLGLFFGNWVIICSQRMPHVEFWGGILRFLFVFSSFLCFWVFFANFWLRGLSGKGKKIIFYCLPPLAEAVDKRAVLFFFFFRRFQSAMSTSEGSMIWKLFFLVCAGVYAKVLKNNLF